MRAAKSILTALVLMLSAISGLALAPVWQHRPPSSSKAAPQAPPGSPPMNAGPPGSPQVPNSYQPHLNGPGPHHGDWLRKYMALPPAQQEKQLQQDPSFRSLPPQKQDQLLDRLRNFNSQPPEQKAKILNRMETFEHMTPAQQATARNLFQRYRNLPDDQRSKVSASVSKTSRYATPGTKPVVEFGRVPQWLYRRRTGSVARDDRSERGTFPLDRMVTAVFPAI